MRTALSAASPWTKSVPPRTNTSTLPASRALGSRVSKKNWRRKEPILDVDFLRLMLVAPKERRFKIDVEQDGGLRSCAASITATHCPAQREKIDKLGGICQLGRNFWR